MSTDDSPTTFDRATAVVGHLDHPLYDDEHLRDVWNEASAVGFQAVCWGVLLAGTATVWFGGPTASLVALLMIGIVGAASVLVMTYAQRRGVDPWRSPGTGRTRWALSIVLGLLLLAGMIRGLDVDPGLAEVLGVVVGGLVGAGGVLLLIALAMRVARRRAPQGED